MEKYSHLCPFEGTPSLTGDNSYITSSCVQNITNTTTNNDNITNSGSTRNNDTHTITKIRRINDTTTTISSRRNDNSSSSSSSGRNNHTNNINNNIKVDFCNIRSMVNKTNLINQHLSSSDIDLLFLTESWLTPKIPDCMVCPPGYDIVRHDRQDPSKSKGGGVCVLYKSFLNVKEIRSNICDDNKYEYVCIDLYDGKSPIRFCCLYIPPTSSLNNKITINACNTIYSLLSPLTPGYIFGDFNLPKINWHVPTCPENDPPHNSFLNFCLSNNLIQCIYETTHQKGNVLDLLLCNPLGLTNLLTVSINSPLTSSCDHCLISFSIRIKNYTKKFPKTTYRNFKKANFDQINNELSNQNWNNLYIHNDNTQTIYNNFILILHNVIEQFIPVNNIHSTKNKTPRHIKSLLQTKLRTYKKLKNDRSLRSRYKQVSKDYENAVNAWNDKIELNVCKNPSTKIFYNYVNKKIKSHSSIPPLCKINGNPLTTDSEKTDAFNKYFQSVFTTDNGSSVHPTSKEFIPMPHFTITKSDIQAAVRKLKGKVSRTPEDIPSFFIKHTLPSIIDQLVIIFNLILQSNTIPHQWKTAIVVPIFKKGNRSKVENYRPISLTSCLCRIFESIIYVKILSHLQTNSLLSPYQFGFLPHRNSCSQLLSCLYKWTISFCSKTPTHVIYADYAKAFDSVSHHKLIEILISYGISNSLIHWIANFLKDRQQVVAIKNTLSSPLPVLSGVPQGSVLGPLLFTIFINDITESANFLQDTGGIALFADDTKVYGTDALQLQESLNFITNWTDRMQLNLAPHKCFSLQIAKPSYQSTSTHFHLDQTLISSSTLVKDLGIFISSDLTWSHHINHIFKNASATSYIILKTFKTKNIWTLVKLFNTYVRPKVEYNTPVWSPSLKKDIIKIESIQRKFTRAAFLRCGIQFSSYSDRLQKLSIKSLSYRRVVFDVIFMYKIVSGLSDLNFEDYFVCVHLPYNFRGGTSRVDPKVRLTDSVWCNCFFSRITNVWNSLPTAVKSSTSLFEFKRKLCDFDLSPFVKEGF